MSLKTMHILFISASICLAFFLGGWLMNDYQHTKDVTEIIFAVGSWLLALTLIWYAKAILRKLRQISFL